MVNKKFFPQPDKERKEWLNLNGLWDFSFERPEFNRKIEVPFSWSSPLSKIGENFFGTAYYRKTVKFDTEKERVFLCFGAVDFESEVFINGEKAACHKGGYDRFDVDITKFFDKTKENEIVVKVTDSESRKQLRGKQSYGEASGIWQTVWLEARSDAYIEEFFVKTSLSGDITYDVTTLNAPDGSLVTAEFEGKIFSAEVKDNFAQIKFKIADPKLWSPESPYLYEGTLKVSSDTVYTYFGIREIGTGIFGKNKRNYITLNGKPLFLNGVLDQSFNPKGYFTLPSDEECKKEIERLKELNINLARIHIKVEEPLKLYFADKLGMLVMEDVPCFWGAPCEEAKAQYEIEMERLIKRDRNHPSTIYWVIFNESWGLLHDDIKPDGTNKKIYKDETAKWVVSCFKKAKALDPTRLIEDNSPNRKDHTITDVNSFHFYANGYKNVKKDMDNFCDNTYPGTSYNFHDGFKSKGEPCINSECGNVWGVKGNAGESDISWQYKYMMNEFRFHELLCGFVFTEFHDVVNEFNGYYKIDNSKKDFGYSQYGISFADLHSQDFLGCDYPPMKTVKPFEKIEVPLFVSSFTDKNHNKNLEINWELKVIDSIDNNSFVSSSGRSKFVIKDYGLTEVGIISTDIPDINATAILSFELSSGGEKIMKNCVCFDIEKERTDAFEAQPTSLNSAGFERVIKAVSDNKISGLNKGEFSLTVNSKDIPNFKDAKELEIIFEASSRKPMAHDFENSGEEHSDLEMFQGYSCDPGENPNSFPQTDEYLYASDAELIIDNKSVKKFELPDCPADSRGLLSHHYQPVDNLLDEAGSYGYKCSASISGEDLENLKAKESFELKLKESSGHGLSVFGRKSGRYPFGILIRAK